MKKYIRKAILLTITLLLVGASPIQMVAAVAAEQSNLKSGTHDKIKTAALLDKVFKMPKRQSKVDTSADTDKAPAEVQPEPEADPVPEPDEPDVTQKEKISEPTLAPQLKATETITGTYGTSPWTLNPDTGVLEFGAGILDSNTSIRDDSVLSSYVSQIKEIKFLADAKLPAVANHMFWQLTSLEKFDSANLDTSNTGYMAYMFYGSNVTTLDLGNFDTSHVTDMNHMFWGSKAETLDLSSFDTSKVTNMGYMFGDSSTTTLILSSFDTSAVTTMYSMFANSNVTTLDLSNFDTSAVTIMRNMFYGSKTAALNLSDFNTSHVTDMSHMFYGSKAATLDLSNFDTSKVTDMSYMFGDSSTTTLILSSFDTSAVTTMYSMFANSNVTTLDLSNFDTSAVTTMRSMFYGSKTAALNLSDFNSSSVTDMSYMFFRSRTTSLNLSNFDTSAVTDMSYMFSMSDITVLNLSSFDTSSVVNMSYMFYGTKATALTLSSFNTSAVTDMSYMFGSSKTTELDLANFDTSAVTSMNGMFSSSRATTLDLSSFNTSAVTDMSSMFYYSSVETLDLSNFDTSAVTDMRYMFYQARVLTLDLSAFTFKSGCNVNYMLYAYNGNLWKLTLGAGQTFSGNSNIMDPSRGSTIPGAGSDYVSGGRWQVVGDGTDHAPTRAKISGADIPSDSRAVKTTYVWEHLQKWYGVNGNSPWYLNPDDGVLTFYKSEDGSPTVLAEQIYDNFNNQFGWGHELYKLVTAIRFEDDVAAPVNASSLFYGLENVESIDCTNLDTSNVENMDSMFSDLYSLTTLNIDGFNTDKVTDMRGMFSNVSGLSSLDLSHFNTDKVEDMAFMFVGMPNLTTLDLSSFDTSNVKNMFGMFALNGVKHLNLSHFNTDKVENMQAMFLASLVETLDISSFDLSGLKDVDSDDGLGLTSPVALMFSAMSVIDPEAEQGSNLWQVKLGEQTVFPDDSGFEAAPAAGTTIPDTSYVTTAASWQAVGTGTEFNPQGAMVTTAEMYADRTEPVTYVWANKAEPPTIDSVSNLTFGTLGASDFFNGNSPLATNMATGSVALKDLGSSTTYHVTVAQTSDWTTDGESATIAKSDLKIKYGANDLSTSASSFWSGTSATATKNILFNHDDTKNFSIWLNPNAVLSTNLLGKQLESELTWTLSETPE